MDKSFIKIEANSITFSVNKVKKQKIHNFVDSTKAFETSISFLDVDRKKKSSRDYDGIGKILFKSFDEEFKGKKFVDVSLPGPIAAIGYAFANHQNLTLSPSDFIIMIGQGLATHINNNSERLRKHFVNHEGKQEILVEVEELDFKDKKLMSYIFEEFSTQIKDKIKKDIYDVVIDDTSVATHTTKIVSNLNLMDSMKRYFQYGIQISCGFPKITLLGKPEDWKKLENKIHKLNELNGKNNELDLDWWLKNLVPVVDKICEAGIYRKIDHLFWSNLFQESEFYFSKEMRGWINAFFPFLNSKSRNMCLERGFNKNFVYPFGPDPEKVKEGISEVPFKVKYRNGGIKDFFFYSGFLGALYDEETDSLKNAHFWIVAEPKS